MEYKMNVAFAFLKYDDNISGILRSLCILLSDDKDLPPKQSKVINQLT